ncbi:two-component system sensor histidine kinase EvgS [Luteibacter sp. Sphag1AF]|uniref:transporter substrate-binding domain-containing protein n=1 Tax=Luteibacter sp. Sphag1AF TaxID=2587031 RepID=UPI00160AC966|nr:transporter substrate-binding domain-containing protein [Luteibacter sp. Sphag1AF]MBB3227868.1 two-component system sensor histidine kinase EvgS [Luteibacter sp. Sphag1AF]
MSLLKYIFVIVLLCVASAANATVADLRPDEKAWLAQHPVIEAGSYAEGFAPFEMERAGHMEGVAPNYLRELARRLGIEVRFKVYPTWSDALRAARAGQIDVLMNVTPTPDRAAYLLFGQPYFEQMPVVITRRSDTTVTHFSDLKGRTVATQRGYAEAETISRYVPDVNIVEAATGAEALRMVASSRADATVDDPDAARAAIAAEHLEDQLQIGPVAALPISTLAFAVPRDKDRAPLLSALDRASATLSAQDHARLRAPWVGGEAAHVTAPTGVPLTDAERQWLSRLPALRVGIDPAAGPITMTNGQGQAEGIGADYLAEISRALGIETTFIPTPDWAVTRRLVERGDIDLLPSASPFGDLPDQPFDFSTPYLEFPVMIVTREGRPTMSGLAELAGLRVAANVMKPPIAAATRQLQQSTLVPVQSTAQGLAAVADGRADAFIGDIATSEYIMRRDYPGRLKFAAPTGEIAVYTVGVRHEYAPLVPLINRVLRHMSDRRSREIRNAWLSSEYTYGGSWTAIARKTMPVILLVLTLLAVISYAYLRLRRETRKRMATEAQLADVTRHIPAVVYRCRYYDDGRLEFLYVGGNPVPIFGISADVFIQDERLAFARIEPADQPLLMAEVARAATTITPIKAVMRIRDTDPVRWVASHATPSRTGNAVDFTGYWVDVTHERQQAEQLEAARDLAESATRAKSEFLATMSHEIRTPMNGVIGMLELMGDTPLDARQRRMLGTVETSAAALLQILDDVLDVSRIEAGRLSIERTPVDLRALLTGVHDLMAGQAQSKGLQFETTVDDALAPRVLTDGVRVRQVLLNLVSNALKFTASGSVRVELTVTATYNSRQSLSLVVSDTGIGVTPEQARRLFEPFSQAESSTTRRYGGSGLGLAISRQLVELLGGSIRMESQPDVGTRLLVLLDVDIAGNATAAIPERASSAAPAPTVAMPRPLHVLVAEDNPVNQALVAAQLEKLGHTSHVVSNGEEALAAYRAHSYDLLVTDCHMPEMDGYELARAIRQDEASTGRHLRIVAMTANALAGARQRCHDAGMDDYLAKPFRSADLGAILGVSSDMTAPATALSWNEAELLDTFGSAAVVKALASRFASTARTELATLASLIKNRDSAAAADWLHRMAGGMRVFGKSAAADEAEFLEHALRLNEGSDIWERLAAFDEVLSRHLTDLSDFADSMLD